MTKNLLLIVGMFVLLQSCSPGYVSRTNVALSQAYTYQPHNGPVEVFFNGMVPTRPYVEIGLIELVGGQFHSIADLTLKLRSRAQDLGADAVIHVIASRLQREDTTLLDILAGNKPDVFTASVITGIAIKYKVAEP